jgi:hypothetical protein
MSTQADIKSTDTLVFIKTALAAFAHESGQAVSEIEIQSQRAVDWVTVDQVAYWKTEVRRAADQVNKAIKDLEHCRAFKKVGDNQPSCIEEKKALEKARRRLEYVEKKAELVRRWSPVLQQEFREMCVRLVRFREVIELDCPKAMARLDQMLRALDAYTSTTSPSVAAATAGTSDGPAMTRATEETAATTPVTPPAADAATPASREEV